MATSKMKVIKSTLKKAIDYIANPEKTDGGRLIYSHGCSVETADIEMELTAKKGTGIGDRIAYHMIQSFALDDDISPEKALQLGIEYAQKVTGGNYEFVVTTHIDKDHIHNHIIFNSVDYVKHRKYHSDAMDKYRIRDINDEICKANDLSVLPKYKARRKFKYKNKHEKQNDTLRNKLKVSIDQAISSAETFDDFLFAMEMEGYEIKRGAHITFKAPDWEKGIRLRSLESKVPDEKKRYSEEAIKKRIANKDKEPVPQETQNATGKKSSEEKNTAKTQKSISSQKKAFSSNRINLLVDIQKNIKAQQSKGYEQALIRSNINTLVKTMNFLISHKITTTEDFEIYAEGKNAEYALYRGDIKKIENELLDLSEKIKFTQNYKKNASVFYGSRRAADPAAYAREHQDEIVLFKASEIYFKRKQLKPKELNLTEMFEQYKNLKAEKSDLDKKSGALKKEIRELETVAENIEKVIGEERTENLKNKETQKTEKGQEK